MKDEQSPEGAVLTVLPCLSYLSQPKLAFEAGLGTDAVGADQHGWLSLSFSGKHIGPGKADGS